MADSSANNNNHAQSAPVNMQEPQTRLRQLNWWYDVNVVSQRQSPSANFGQSLPASASTSLSQSFTAAPQIGGQPRRDSLKNMMHLSDFATP